MNWLRAAVAIVPLTLVLQACRTLEAGKPLPVASAPGASKQESAEELFASGVTAYEGGRYREAEALFGRTLESAPRWVNAQYNLGLVAEREGNLGKAEAAYEAALRIDPSHQPSLLNLSRLFHLRGDFAKAVAVYEKAVATPGKEADVELLNNLAVAYRLAKNLAKAEATARQVLSRTSDNAGAYKNLALIYCEQGQYSLAEAVILNARKIDDQDPGIHNSLGLIYLKLNERQRALAQFQQAVSLDNKFVPGHLNLGALALAYRDYDAAEREFAEAVRLEPGSYQAHLDHAYALDGQKARDARKGLAAGAEFENVQPQDVSERSQASNPGLDRGQSK